MQFISKIATQETSNNCAREIETLGTKLVFLRGFITLVFFSLRGLGLPYLQLQTLLESKLRNVYFSIKTLENLLRPKKAILFFSNSRKMACPFVAMVKRELCWVWSDRLQKILTNQFLNSTVYFVVIYFRCIACLAIQRTPAIKTCYIWKFNSTGHIRALNANLNLTSFALKLFFFNRFSVHHAHAFSFTFAVHHVHAFLFIFAIP